MNSIVQKIYWMAPYFAKCWIASWNAWKLDKLRHGVEFEPLIRQITERNSWSHEQFAEYQLQEIRKLIRHAATNVPYYRKVFNERGIDSDCIHELEDLARLPILEKDIVRADPLAIVDERLDHTKLIIMHTSGTTGTPLDLYLDISQYTMARAYMAARVWSVAGMRRRRNPSVSIGGHLVTAPNRTKPPFWVVNRRWKQLYMSSYHLAPEYINYYVKELRRFKADYIEGIPSSVYAIARYILDKKLDPVPLRACFTTSETLFDYQREAIKQAFGCKTYNQYGCGEHVVFAAECKHGSMHLSPEFGIVEIVDDSDKPVPIGQTGQLICTSLTNRVQPFIRYRVGDVGALQADNCSCGSLLPILKSIEGRIDDVLITRDGRLIGRLDPVFKGTRGIIEAQIVQDDYDKFRVRVVPSQAYSNNDGREIKTSLLARVGEAHVQIELVDRIERGPGGKFKAVVRNMPKERKG